MSIIAIYYLIGAYSYMLGMFVATWTGEHKSKYIATFVTFALAPVLVPVVLLFFIKDLFTKHEK